MKKVVLFAVIGFCFLVFPASVFAGGKCEVTVVNRTGAAISQVIVKESENDTVRTYYMDIEKNSTSEIKLKKNAVYDIVLFDNKGHKYGKTGCKLKGDSQRLEIKSTDFMSQGAWDLFKKLLNL